MQDQNTTALAPVDQRARVALLTGDTESKLIAAAGSTKDITQVSDRNGREIDRKSVV